MLPFRKIIFPVDYSDACRAVAPYVKHAVQHFSAQLTLIHSYGEEGLSFFDFPVSGAELATRVREFEEARLSEFAADVFAGIHTERFAELGEAGTAIHEVLQRQGGDLIMLPTHGRGPVRRMMLGSVTAKLLHDVSCAVWTSTSSASAANTPEYRSIVCAVDDNPEALAVIKAGAALAKSYKADLAVVHVLGLPPMSMELDYAAIKNDLLQAARGRLREAMASVKVEAPHAVLEGNIASALNDWAAERKADLLITGRGRSLDGLGSVWSNLYSIVRESACPVISI